MHLGPVPDGPDALVPQGLQLPDRSLGLRLDRLLVASGRLPPSGLVLGIVDHVGDDCQEQQDAGDDQEQMASIGSIHDDISLDMGAGVVFFDCTPTSIIRRIMTSMPFMEIWRAPMAFSIPWTVAVELSRVFSTAFIARMLSRRSVFCVSDIRDTWSWTPR